MHMICFQNFFVWAFKIVVDSWIYSILLLYILWDDGPIFMISGSNQQLQKQLEYTLLNPDCHCWWISKMQSERRDTFEEWYAIIFCFKLGENDTTETYGMLQTVFWPSWINRASVSEWHKRSKEGRECAGGVRKSIHQSWLAKGLGLGLYLLCWNILLFIILAVVANKTQSEALQHSLEQIARGISLYLNSDKKRVHKF